MLFFLFTLVVIIIIDIVIIKVIVLLLIFFIISLSLFSHVIAVIIIPVDFNLLVIFHFQRSIVSDPYFILYFCYLQAQIQEVLGL